MILDFHRRFETCIPGRTGQIAVPNDPSHTGGTRKSSHISKTGVASLLLWDLHRLCLYKAVNSPSLTKLNVTSSVT